MPDSTDLTGEVFVESDDEPVTLPETPDKPGALRTATAVGGRLVLGCVAVGAIATLVGAAILLPLPSARSTAVSTVVTPVPAGQQLVCPGGLLRLGSASGTGATTVSAIGSPRIVSAARPGSVIAKAFAVTDAGTGNAAAAPQLLAQSPLGASSSALVAGAQSESVLTDEFFGLAAAECTAPSGSTWLAGGATSVGRTTLLLLANPTPVASVVSVQIYGETGQITAPGMDGIAVAAGSQRVLSLAGFAPNLRSPVVHVSSSGGQVVASLEQSTVRGLTPGGIEFIGGTASAALTTVLPGVVVTGTAAIQSLQGQSGFDDLQTILRVYLPGHTPTTAAITILAENGTVVGAPIKADVQPGSVTDLPLDELSDGSYTVIVTSAVPLLASVRVSTAIGTAAAGAPGALPAATTGETDFAWVTAATALTDSVLVPIATGLNPALHLDNPTSTPQTITLRGGAGPDITATVGAHRALSIPVVAGDTYRMTGFTRLYASVSVLGPGEVSSYGVSPLAPGEGPIRVYR